MRKHVAVVSGIALLCLGTSATPQSPSEEYNKFRQQILSDYRNFKSQILEHYADFLNGEWHEFESLWEEETPYSEPKPKKLPELPPLAEREPDPEPEVAKLPDPTFNQGTLPGLNAALPGNLLAEGSIKDYDHPSMRINTPDFGGGAGDPWASISVPTPSLRGESEAMKQSRSNYERAALHLPDPEFAFGPFPGQTVAADPSDSGIVNIDMKSSVKFADNFIFDFYGMEAFIPEVEFNITSSLTGPEETGRHWEMMADQEGGVETSRQLFGLAQQLGLNGYLTFRLTEAYVNQRFTGSNINARMSAVHYLLSNMGYDVRLLKLEDIMTVMMPFDQKVVYSTLTTTANNGRKYTVLYPDGYKINPGKSVKLMTCDLPSNATGKTSDLRLTGLNLPENPKAFTLTNGKLTLKGVVNENIRNILYHYPQMPNGDFASSWVDSALRENIIGQLKTQLADMPQKEAINTLMTLCHYGFEYKTDQEWHGFEKPYFLEENFLYEYNDCEDRAIFFSYLVWNTLGIPCQLIQYPGHESATVALSDDIKGFYYNTNGVRYYSADPTYLGSHIGMVMPSYQSASPVIDKQYSED